MAKVRVIDFTGVKAPVLRTADGKRVKASMNPKSIRHRARKGKLTKEEFDILYKPLEEWDEEELARGRPRDKNGKFTGRAPTWVSREMHEAIVGRFKEVVKTNMNTQTVTALTVIHRLISNEDVDLRGRPLVPPSVKAELSKWLVEHIIGKPTVHQEVDISVRLQGLLATATVSTFGTGVGQDAMGGDVGKAADYLDAFGLGMPAIEAGLVDDDD